MFRGPNHAPRAITRTRAIAFLSLCFVGAQLLGCQETLEPTEVVLAVDSDLEAGTELSALKLAIYSSDDDEAPLRAQTIALAKEAGSGVQTLPLTLSIAAGDRDSRAQFRVVVTGVGPEEPDKADSTLVDLVEQQAITGFVPGRRPLLEMYLSRGCIGMLCRGPSAEGSPQACSLATETCEVIEAIDASTLPQTVGDGLEQLTIPDRPDAPGMRDATMPPVKEPDGGAPMLTCDPGYALVDGLCEDVDECLVAPFPCPEGTCENLPGSYRCDPCDAGYRADGAGACNDVDECAQDFGGCDARTTCTNTPGGRTCGPRPTGYTGDGESGCIGTGPCADDNVMITVGSHELEARAAEHMTLRRRIHVRDNHAVTLNLDLVPLADGTQPRAEAASEDSSVFGEWWLWTGLGAVVVGGVVTGLVLANQDAAVQKPSGGTSGIVVTLP